MALTSGTGSWLGSWTSFCLVLLSVSMFRSWVHYYLNKLMNTEQFLIFYLLHEAAHKLVSGSRIFHVDLDFVKLPSSTPAFACRCPNGPDQTAGYERKFIIYSLVGKSC